MAGATAVTDERAPTITIDPEHLPALVAATGEDVITLAEEVTSITERDWDTSTADELEATIDRFAVRLELMRATQTGELALTADVAATLERWRKLAVDYLDEQLAALKKLRAGDEGYCHVGSTPARTEARVLDEIDDTRRELAMCRAILEQLED